MQRSANVYDGAAAGLQRRERCARRGKRPNRINLHHRAEAVHAQLLSRRLKMKSLLFTMSEDFLHVCQYSRQHDTQEACLGKLAMNLQSSQQFCYKRRRPLLLAFGDSMSMGNVKVQ